MPRVLGFDVSANRIAWALCDGAGQCSTEIVKRHKLGLLEFIDSARSGLQFFLHGIQLPDAYCIEINLRPAIMNKGKQSPNMVKAYMRSRWVEGAFLMALRLAEPLMIQKIPGGFHKLPAGYVFALQASGGKDAKGTRRRRMVIHYNLLGRLNNPGHPLSEDEIDALAVAHECAIALTTGVREDAK